MTKPYSAELERLTVGDPIARPAPVRARGGQWRRDPAAEWDWYYHLDPSARQWISRSLMAPGGWGPDVLADWAGFDSVDAWADALVQAVDVARSGDFETSTPDLVADWERESVVADALGALVGPDEVAELLAVNRSTLAQWRHRDTLPAPDLTLSGLTIWHRSTVLEWARRTGREIQEVSQ